MADNEKPTSADKTGFETPIDGLGSFVRDTQFKNWRTDRQDIDKKWEGNREAFHGIVNESDQWKEEEGKDWRSSTYVMYTKQKVMAAYAQVIDFLLQNGRIPFDIVPSKWDEFGMDDMDEVDREYVLTEMNNQKDLIDQELSETRADRALMSNVMAAAIYGETYAKTPIEEVLRRGYREVPIEGVDDTSGISQDQRAYEPYEESYTTRSWDYVSNWNIFRNRETNDLKECEGVIQRELVSPYWLRQQMGKPYWIDAGIEDSITNCATKSKTGAGGTGSISADLSSLPPVLREIKYRYKTLEYIEYWGRVPRQMAENYEEWLGEYFEAMREAEKSGGEFKPPSVVFDDMIEDDGDEIEVMVAMAEQYIVRYVRTTPDQRPFHMAVWDQNVDELENQGVADNVKDMQKVINGAFRALEDNKKLASNVILGIKERLFENMPKSLKPGTKLQVSDEVEDIREALFPIVIPDVGSSVIDLIQIAFQIGDEDSMIPKIQQGFQEAGTQTAFQISQQLAKAGKYLGQAIKNIDEGLIEPIITAFYDYNMMNPEINIGKGNFSVEAQGFQSYQNRSQLLTILNQVLTLALSHPALEQQTKIRRIYEDIIKALDLSTDDYLLSVEEIKESVQNQQPDPMMVAELDKTKSETEKNLADAAKKLADAAKKLSDADQGEAQTKIKRAETVSKIEDSRRPQPARQLPLPEPELKFARTPTQPSKKPGEVPPKQ